MPPACRSPDFPLERLSNSLLTFTGFSKERPSTPTKIAAARAALVYRFNPSYKIIPRTRTKNSHSSVTQGHCSGKLSVTHLRGSSVPGCSLQPLSHGQDPVASSRVCTPAVVGPSHTDTVHLTGEPWRCSSDALWQFGHRVSQGVPSPADRLSSERGCCQRRVPGQCPCVTDLCFLL